MHQPCVFVHAGALKAANTDELFDGEEFSVAQVPEGQIISAEVCVSPSLLT